MADKRAWRLSLPLSPFIVTLGLWGALRGLAKGLGDNQPIYFDGDDTLAALMLPEGLLPPGVWVLLVVAIAVLAGSLQGYALSLAGLRRQVDPHWKRGMSFLRIGLAALQMAVADAAARLMDWLPIPIQELEPCIPSRKARRRQAQVWFSTIEMPPRLRSAADHTPELAVT